MKYFIDTEFLEDFTHPWIGKARHYIDLISIGIVAEDGREYYAVSNEFDIDHVWNKYDLKPMTNLGGIGDTPTDMKVYWLRDNVLMPIFYDMAMEDFSLTHYKDEWTKSGKGVTLDVFKADPVWSRDLRWFKKLIKKFGKHNRRIAEEVAYFAGKGLGKPEFYGYYADYDWVLFCSLYGRMLDLPNEFPMYCRDLKQMYDERSGGGPLKAHPTYPKQSNAHNALDDARWNMKLHDFLQTV